MFDKILISACFLGANVRYNGVIKPLEDDYLTLWHDQGRLVSVCPEVIGGLAVPRTPAEINQDTGKVVTADNCDVSEPFNNGAKQALALCKNQNIKYALLKESSPSCGSNFIYDGTFSHQKIKGEGLTCKLLRQHGIQVFSESSITDLAKLLAVKGE